MDISMVDIKTLEHAFLDNVSFIEFKDKSFWCTVHSNEGKKKRRYLDKEYQIESIKEWRKKE